MNTTIQKRIIWNVCLAAAAFVVFVTVLPTGAFGKDWERVIDEQGLLEIVNNTVHLGQTKRYDYGFQWRGEYCSNGTGVIYANGNTYPRTWRISEDHEICATTSTGEKCYRYERSLNHRNKYRGGVEGMPPPFVFIITDEKPEYCSKQ